jgi:hypothetical protein
VFRAFALEEVASRVRGDANTWAFPAMARRKEEATHKAALREEEECHLRLKQEAELRAASPSDPRSA